MRNSEALFLSQMSELRVVGSRFDLDRRFPAVPIVGVTGSCWILAFDDILTSHFADRLIELTDAFDDQWVEVLAVDQDPTEWLDNQGVVPAFAAGRSSLVRSFLDGLWKSPDRTIGWELGHVADVFAIVGSSANWALWVQRDWEIGLLVTAGSFQLAASEDAPVVLPDEDFEMWRGPAGWTLELTPAMLETFRANVRGISE